MSYYKEDLNLTNKNSLSQQKSTFKAWIFGRDREERSQVINALKQEQWPLVTIQSLDYFESLASQLSPDILILCSDIMSTFGNQLIRELRKKGTTFPILCIGKILQAENCIIALEEGADDYLHSPLNTREFVSRARRAAKLTNGSHTTPAKTDNNATYTICNLQFYPETKNLESKSGQHVSLTTGEVNLLLLLCENKGVTISRQRLASLTETESSNSRTIDVRISKLKKKITLLDPNETYITSKRHEGYHFTSDTQAIQEIK